MMCSRYILAGFCIACTGRGTDGFLLMTRTAHHRSFAILSTRAPLHSSSSSVSPLAASNNPKRGLQDVGAPTGERLGGEKEDEDEDDDFDDDDFLDDEELPLAKRIAIMTLRLAVNVATQLVTMMKMVLVTSSVLLLTAVGKKFLDVWGEAQRASLRTLQRVAEAGIDVASFAIKLFLKWLASRGDANDKKRQCETKNGK